METVRKVLKQHRGRVLLADEVGLGKTVEAACLLGIRAARHGRAHPDLTPASLVGQWRDEMESSASIRHQP
jgi:SNF2 family DNA or RNA helicase